MLRNLLPKIQPVVGTRAASTFAKITLCGNIAEPEIKTGKNGKDYARLPLATSVSVAPAEDGQPQEETNWHTVFAFGEQVERIRNLRKGSLLYVEADYSLQKYQQDENSPIYKLPSIRARSIKVLKRSAPKENIE
ncbi:nucleic acid-binding protein [Wallemia mellicola]|uniref:Single-stranded DNA-binding protein n=2 Tax=Wallemia mellicola TaxID=1708541 RepID=A0A4T0QR31_9BASI|nr:nucleic acid-binding protein [Wallemia mellicola CBS 633.66]TIB70010.1 hypothetical protein E3Q24_03158 [Wallemia mellicola]EIM22620.1 nucleic acid-binding protein [Wallemia mellicola CBS 633.66]TIB75718.1 hypothetical protein E3Q23_02278 [Wallemia mellicola]TIB78439.1 nucleic acid-binding protein [Wallemia mellicola]TIB84081.1 nucleic acid-binding protein [Wallemia mellicola]|eukprot:XP_006957286.1 nucleic acid-binding protein [Wallemia mellicola CBS 633.66]